jgi:hypothetical protein
MVNADAGGTRISTVTLQLDIWYDIQHDVNIVF